VNQEQHRLRRTRLRHGALAVEVKFHVALVGRILVRLDFGLGALRARLADEARHEAGPGAGDHGSSHDRKVGHDFLQANYSAGT